jgi:hypothetical protein
VKRRIWGLAALMLTSGAQAQPEFKNYTAPGNLESTVKLGCIAQSEIKTSYNPVDLYIGAKACIDADNYERAVALFQMASIFGRYDMQRVADKTAHQAIIVGRIQILGSRPPEKIAKFQSLAKTTAQDAAKIQVLCKDLRHIGPPTYYPRYMIQHGLNAFTSGANALVPDFSAAQGWDLVLNTYVHCPAA